MPRNIKSIPWQKTWFLTLEGACEILKCTFPQMDDHIRAGRIRVSAMPGHRQRGRLRRVYTEDVAALIHEDVTTAVFERRPNYFLGDHLGCGACLSICATCKKIKGRCTSSLINEYEAYEILGYSVNLMALLRKNNVYIDQKRKNHRISFDDVAKIKRQRVLEGIDTDLVRREIIGSLGTMIELRQQEMAELDADLIRYSVGSEQPRFRYGRVVDLIEPPKKEWYVYHLCHPSGRPFYVGKGIGGRMYQHEKEAQNGKGGNTYKTGVIRKLLKRGDKVRYRVVFVTPEETEAYEYEICEIARLGGYKKLTNMTPGGATREEYDRVFGSQVPKEQLSYRQFIERLRLYPTLTVEKRKNATYAWAVDRAYELRRLRDDAEGLGHDEAVRKIDEELDMVRPYATRQTQLSDMIDGRHWRSRHEWDGR